jgi:hypothetical protein
VYGGDRGLYGKLKMPITLSNEPVIHAGIH